ncbi:unnamed protein product [Prorocentrum cordatum]|uniref:Uncharacterized protein n=1 Tax=Prorocentrum cordatum TaxID=2364126 RepID=A0ABN9WS13_9DINO|nr:unnamed protein product [Polarella glacialis]
MRKMRRRGIRRTCNTGARPWEDELVGQKADTTDAVLYRSRSMKRPTWLLCPHTKRASAASSHGGRAGASQRHEGGHAACLWAACLSA